MEIDLIDHSPIEFRRVSMGKLHGRRCYALAISTALSQGIVFSGLSASFRRQIRCPKSFLNGANGWNDWKELHVHKSVGFTAKNLRLSLQAVPICKLIALDQ